MLIKQNSNNFDGRFIDIVNTFNYLCNISLYHHRNILHILYIIHCQVIGQVMSYNLNVLTISIILPSKAIDNFY